MMDAATHTTIELQKEYLHFSAAHFTIFSATERENLHGHNFQVAATLDGPVAGDGLCFDYNEVKSRLKTLCDSLDETVLLPERSPHLEVRREDGLVYADFADEHIPFLPRDVKTLPVRNITVEELVHWFLTSLLSDPGFRALPIDRIRLQVASGAGQWASTEWKKP